MSFPRPLGYCGGSLDNQVVSSPATHELHSSLTERGVLKETVLRPHSRKGHEHDEQIRRVRRPVEKQGRHWLRPALAAGRTASGTHPDRSVARLRLIATYRRRI